MIVIFTSKQYKTIFQWLKSENRKEYTFNKYRIQNTKQDEDM